MLHRVRDEQAHTLLEFFQRAMLRFQLQCLLSALFFANAACISLHLIAENTMDVSPDAVTIEFHVFM